MDRTLGGVLIQNCNNNNNSNIPVTLRTHHSNLKHRVPGHATLDRVPSNSLLMK